MAAIPLSGTAALIGESSSTHMVGLGSWRLPENFGVATNLMGGLWGGKSWVRRKPCQDVTHYPLPNIIDGKRFSDRQPASRYGGAADDTNPVQEAKATCARSDALVIRRVHRRQVAASNAAAADVPLLSLF